MPAKPVLVEQRGTEHRAIRPARRSASVAAGWLGGDADNIDQGLLCTRGESGPGAVDAGAGWRKDNRIRPEETVRGSVRERECLTGALPTAKLEPVKLRPLLIAPLADTPIVQFSRS